MRLTGCSAMRRNTCFGLALVSVLCAGQAAARTDSVRIEEQKEKLPEKQEAGTLDAITVTGSRLARRPLTLTAPLVMLSAEEIDLSGAINLENMLNAQPQFIGGQTSRSNNPGTGAAQLDLRGLGSNRNLVLVNGRRYIYFSENQFTDINTIPAALVERVEIVTGGSSAVYGSDAIAGVINFILRDDFEGAEFRGQVGGDTRGDAVSRSVDFTLGSNFLDDRGNVTLSFSYFDRGAILQGQRSYSRVNLADGVNALGVPTLFGQGSLQTPNGAFSNIPFGAALNPAGMTGLRTALNAAGLSGIGSAGFTFDGAGSSARAFIDPADRYNFALLNYLQVPSERLGASGFSHFDLDADTTIYAEAAYFQTLVDIQLAESNISAIFPINIDSPFVSAEIREVFRQLDLVEAGAARGDRLVNLRIARRFSEFGARQALITRESFRIGGGIKGELDDVSDRFLRDLNFDVSYFFSQSEGDSELNGLVSRSRLGAGLLRATPGATPLVNPFGVGNISPDAIRALRIDTVSPSKTWLKVFTANATSGEVVDLPAGPLAASFGLEWRATYASSRPDPALASGDGVGFSSFQPTAGEVGVVEVFSEARAPLFSQDSVLGAVAANGAFRYSRYDLDAVGGVWTYLGGLEWSPLEWISIRGQVQRAVRAPGIGELFGGQINDRPRATDPCATPAAATNPALRALCVATGVPAAVVGTSTLQPEARIDAVFGGNPALIEERSDTVTFGVSFSPATDLQISLDYFDITIDDAIAPLAGGVDSILNLCYNVIRNADSAVCRAVQRNPVDGVIAAPFAVRATNSNIGSLQTSGLDMAINYRFEVPFGLLSRSGDISIDARGVWLDKFTLTPLQDLPQQANECVGAFGLTCRDVRPEFKSATRVSYATGPLTISLRHRHLGEVTDDRILLPRRAGLPEPTALAVPTVAAQDYFDIAFTIDFERVGVSLHGGVNNVLDKDPPILGSSQQQANTYPSTYDALGAEYFLGMRMSF